MVAPPKYTADEFRQALREIHDECTKVFYVLFRGDIGHTASVFRSDVGKMLAYWSGQGFRIVDGPFETQQEAKFECQLQYRYASADRQRGLLGRA
jgi:hypothetical protein